MSDTIFCRYAVFGGTKSQRGWHSHINSYVSKTEALAEFVRIGRVDDHWAQLVDLQTGTLLKEIT